MALWYADERNTVRIDRGFVPPIVRGAKVEANAGYGAGGIGFLPAASGVYVGRNGCVSYFSHDLTTELWRRETSDMSFQLLRLGGDAVGGPANGRIRRYNSEGHVVSEVAARGALQAVGPDLVVTSGGGELVATEWNGDVRWRRNAEPPSHVLIDEQRVLVVEELGCRLVCLDSVTASTKWDVWAPLERAQPAHWFLAGFPSIAIASGRLVTIGRDGGIRLLDRRTGALVASATPPYVGSFLISDADIFFLRPGGWSQIHLATLQEIDRQEYEGEAAEMLRHVLPAAYWVTDETIFFTTLGGQVAAVSRRDVATNQHLWWFDELKGLMAIGHPPVQAGEHLYVVSPADDRTKTSTCLVCYGKPS